MTGARNDKKTEMEPQFRIQRQALAALKEDKTLSELSTQFDVHPLYKTMMLQQWYGLSGEGVKFRLFIVIRVKRDVKAKNTAYNLKLFVCIAG